MADSRDIDLIEELRSQSNELPWLEFKRDNIEPQSIGKRCSAISNAARLEGQDCGYMVWGIDDATHAVVGTAFDPDNHKVGSQEFQLWLAQRLQPSIAFSFRAIAHPDGHVVLLEIPAANSAPVAFDSIAYIRIGSTTPKLADYPERHRALIDSLRPYTWEHGNALQYATGDDVLELLDYAQYFRLTRQPLPDNRAGIFDRLVGDNLIEKDVGQRWNITNLGTILFATDLDRFDASLSRKAVRLVVTMAEIGPRRSAIGWMAPRGTPVVSRGWWATSTISCPTMNTSQRTGQGGCRGGTVPTATTVVPWRRQLHASNPLCAAVFRQHDPGGADSRLLSARGTEVPVWRGTDEERDPV